MVGIAVINAAVSKAGPLEDEVFKLDIRYALDACQHMHSSIVKSCLTDFMHYMERP